MKVYIPTYWGDIRMERQGDTGTELTVEKLTADETLVVERILKKYKIPKPDFTKPKTIFIPQNMDKVHKFVTKTLKRGMPTITAMKIAGGQVTEIRDLEEAEVAGAEAVATTPVPQRGCPMPIFDATQEKSIRATRVLSLFLNPTQKRDFARQHAFAVVGADSGSKYMLAHRHSHLASEHGLVYNLDTKRTTCVEPTFLPPEEEILSLLFALSCQGREIEWAKSLGAR